MKRVLVASMHHESNSFSPIVAGRDDFHVLRGAEVFQHLCPNSSLTGVIQTLQDQGY
ncbi:MAG: M81 family metallopeptidase, partial [Dysosmobacter sp.]|nr:M81 family metallopeptidase [Dysosmobacter sp.]